MIELINGEALFVMDKLITEGIVFDAIITDIPYQMTNCKWDSVIPFNNYIMQQKSKRSKKTEPIYKNEYILQELKKGRNYEEICNYFDKNSEEGMWQKLNKLIKPNGAIVLFGSEPFSSALRMSNIKNYKYDWVWEKTTSGNIALANKQPLRYTENISVFYHKQPTYNKQMIPRDELGKKRLQNKNNPIRFTGNNITGTTKTRDYDINRYDEDFKNPKNILLFKVTRGKIHPTQKPVALMEYLIKTYTNENETVLDFTMGSGTTGVACVNTNRKFIGIELDKEYFEISKERINKAIEEKTMKEFMELMNR